MVFQAQSENKLSWRVARRAIFVLLSRSARKILLTRTLDERNGAELRWLKPDMARFLAALEEEAVAIRPAARLGELPTVGNRLMVELAIFTAASYRTLLGLGIMPATARQTTADIGWDVYATLLRLSSLPFRLITRDPGRRLRWTIRVLLRFPFNAPGAPGYAVKTWTEGGDFYTHFTHCPPQTFVRNLIAERGDEGDLDAFYESWCLYDWPGADLIAGDRFRGHYRRRRTLSRGHPLCDMCWAARASGDAGHGADALRKEMSR